VAGYTRQSSADIVATAVVRANPLNLEFDQVLAAFNASSGHKHDGTTAEGAYVPLIADSDALNKVSVDTSNNRVGVFVEVSSAAVEQIRIQDGVITPVTDNDIDLGTSSVEFKDLYLDGTATIDTLQVDESATITANLTVNGNTTLGNAASDTVTVTADVASPLLPSADDTHDLGAVGSEWRNLYIDGTANIDALVADTADINGGTLDGATIGGSSAGAGTFTTLAATSLSLGGTAVTSTAAELNILDGVTSTAAELNILDGVTSTTAELNILDGVTATAAEINLIDGGTSRGTTAIADGDGVLINDAGTMRMTNVTTLATYMGTKGLGATIGQGAASSLPGSPNNGDFWYDTTWVALYMYYTKDGSNSYFFDVATSGRHLGSTGAGNYAFGFTQGYGGDNTVGLKLHSLTQPGATAEHWNSALAFTHHRKYGMSAIGNTAKAITFGGTDGIGNIVTQMTVYSMVAGNSDAAVDFGDISELNPSAVTLYYHYNGQPISSPTRGIFVSPTGRDGNGRNVPVDVLTYITFDTASDTTDFGNLTVARSNQGSFASTTRGVIVGGNTGTSSIAYSDVLDYITIASTGNATDFGNLSAGRGSFFCGQNTTRGVTMGGSAASSVDTMDYFTIASTGNATDFGNLTANTTKKGVISNGTKSWNGTDIITIATAANATLLAADADYVASYTAFPADSIAKANGTAVAQFAIAPGWIAATG